MNLKYDLTGQKFGKVLVLDRDYNYAKNHNLKTTNAYWHCLCDCGTYFSTQGRNLREGKTKSCGCLQKEKVSQLNYKDITGQTFGFWTVIKRSDKKDNAGCYYWYCDCKCGTKNIEVSGKLLRMGITQSCGCLKSRGEEKIANLLTQNNINFKREYIFNNFKLTGGGIPRFDFAILDNNNKLLYLIEYQGEQHYKFKGNIFTEEKMLYTQKCDKEKKEYCDNNNIPIIYIPYTKYNTLTINDLLLTNE